MREEQAYVGALRPTLMVKNVEQRASSAFSADRQLVMYIYALYELRGVFAAPLTYRAATVVVVGRLLSPGKVGHSCRVCRQGARLETRE